MPNSRGCSARLPISSVIASSTIAWSCTASRTSAAAEGAWQSAEPASNRGRAALRIGAIAIGLLVCLPLHYGSTLAGRTSPWPRRFLKWLGWCAGLRVQISGTARSSNVLLLANHVSWLDIMLLAGATGCAFVSKQEVADWPVAGWLSRLNRTVFISRSERGAVHGQAEQLRSALRSEMPIALFPEGTTEGGIDILPFRASLLAALYPPLDGVKVQPVAIDYHAAAHDIAWIGKEPAGHNALRVLGRRGSIPVTLHFLDPIDPATAGGRKELATLARSRIIDALADAERHGSAATHFPVAADRL